MRCISHRSTCSHTHSHLWAIYSSLYRVGGKWRPHADSRQSSGLNCGPWRFEVAIPLCHSASYSLLLMIVILYPAEKDSSGFPLFRSTPVRHIQYIAFLTYVSIKAISINFNRKSSQFVISAYLTIHSPDWTVMVFFMSLYICRLLY